MFGLYTITVQIGETEPRFLTFARKGFEHQVDEMVHNQLYDWYEDGTLDYDDSSIWMDWWFEFSELTE